jgi:hypothetical protein
MKLKMFVVINTSWGGGDNTIVFGVFTSKEKAEEAINTYTKNNGSELEGECDYFYINEVTLDEPEYV